MGHLEGDKKNQAVSRRIALPAVSKTPLGGTAPGPGMRASIYIFHFKVFQESFLFCAKCLKAYEAVGFWWCSRSLKLAARMRNTIYLFHFEAFQESVLFGAKCLKAYNAVGFWWCSRSLKLAARMGPVIYLFHFYVSKMSESI